MDIRFLGLRGDGGEWERQDSFTAKAQRALVSDYTAFFYMGELIEYDETEKMFTNPTIKKTEDYVTGRFG